MGFDEDNHPRDERGRFSGGALGAWVNSKVSGKTFTDQRPSGMPEETWHAHYDKHPEKGGKASDARIKAVHEPIIHDATDKVPVPPPNEQKMAIFTMGGPGSGKSSIKEGLDTSKFVSVDPDEVRVKLPEYQKATSGGKIFTGAAAMTHEEASHIAKQITERAIQQGKHVIIDGTGKTAASMTTKMQKLKDAGYHVHLMYAHLGAQEGLQRVAERGQRTGRFVPESVVKEAYSAIPKNFQTISKAADSFQVFHTSKDAAGHGPVWEKNADGKETQHDPDFVRKFKKEHGGSS